MSSSDTEWKNRSDEGVFVPIDPKGFFVSRDRALATRASGEKSSDGASLDGILGALLTSDADNSVPERSCGRLPPLTGARLCLEESAKATRPKIWGGVAVEGEEAALCDVAGEEKVFTAPFLAEFESFSFTMTGTSELESEPSWSTSDCVVDEVSLRLTIFTVGAAVSSRVAAKCLLQSFCRQST